MSVTFVQTIILSVYLNTFIDLLTNRTNYPPHSSESKWLIAKKWMQNLNEVRKRYAAFYLNICLYTIYNVSQNSLSFGNYFNLMLKPFLLYKKFYLPNNGINYSYLIYQNLNKLVICKLIRILIKLVSTIT